MPQPAITGSPPILQFGGQAQPNGQGTLAYVNLNDNTNWTWMHWSGGADSDYPLHAVGRYLWRSRGTFLGQDAGTRKITFPMRYRETNAPLGAALAKLSQSGQQFLTFDNLTGIPVKFAGAKKRTLLLKYGPYYWSLDLEFLAPSPYFQDLSAQTFGPAVAVQTVQASVVTARLAQSSATAAPPQLAGSVTGAVNRRGGLWSTPARRPSQLLVQPVITPGPVSFSIAYSGSVWAEPVWTLTIPTTNPAVITSVTLTSALTGEQAIMQFGGLAASTAYTITMDSGAMTIVDQSGKAYDNTGNAYPNLYGPAGQSNAFTLSVAASTGVPSGLTLSASWNPRWEM